MELVGEIEKKDDEDIPVPDMHEEVRKPRVGRRPILPTKADLEEHYPLHLNYRSWCEHCVAGKARLAQHKVEPSDRERLGVTFSADYAFMGAEEAEEGMQATLVLYDDDKRAFWAVGVAQKGPTEPIVKYIKDVLDQSGYEGEKITFKSDQEPAIVALKRAVSAARSGETVPIESPVRASKSNGMMENAIGIWQGQLRTIKHFTESKLKRRLEVNSVMFSWMIPYVTEIINKFKIGSDGRTAYERFTEHKCRHVMIGFGEVVDFMLETDKANMHKADSRVHKGVFLGYAWRTTEYLIATKEAVFKCRTVRRRAEELAYDSDCLDYIKISYDDFVMKGAQTTPVVSFPQGGGPAVPEQVPLRGRDVVPRRPYMRESDFARHGFTQGCKGCTWAQNRLGPRNPHSEACRNRLEEKIAEDADDDRTRLAKERQDHFAAHKSGGGRSNNCKR